MKSESRASALLVDEDEFFCLALRTILIDQLGFADVHIVSSLAAAAEELSRRPDVALVVVSHAPGGFRPIRDVGALRDRFPRPRVVLVSGTEGRGDILAALDAGLHGYVPKSLGLAGLPKALRQVLEGAIYVPPSLARRQGADAWHELERRPADAAAGSPVALTPRQHDVLRHIVEGKSNKEIARSLSLGEGTVKVHVAALFRVLGLTSRSAAAAIGARILADVANSNASLELTSAAVSSDTLDDARSAASAA
ncbi:MAG TPA: response regulator transcription factor [Microvirga sp.]|jgi:DNA-binding NarL/FixJ family response regulator|nr:response regulator transcription factor [Microvirga sp.]